LEERGVGRGPIGIVDKGERESNYKQNEGGECTGFKKLSRVGTRARSNMNRKKEGKQKVFKGD